MPKSSKVVNVTSEYREQIRSLQTEIEQLQKTINMASGSLKKSKEMLNKIKTEKNTLSVGVQLKTYLNSFIRAATDLPSTKETANKFREFYKERTQKEIDGVKTDKAKEKYQTIQDVGLKFIDNHNESVYFACAKESSVAPAIKQLKNPTLHLM